MLDVLVLNAISLNMMCDPSVKLNICEITLTEAKLYMTGNYAGAIGHQDTAAVVESQLGVSGLFNRRNVTFRDAVDFIVAQYSGPRLPEGATIKYYRVTPVYC